MRTRSACIIFVVALLLSLVAARPLYVLSVAEGADPTCTQPTYPVSQVPFTIPSGAVQGDLLPGLVTANGAATWVVTTGPYTRVGRACDPDGDPIAKVELVSGTTPATVTYNATAGTWTLNVTNLPAGIHAFVVRATDAPTDSTPKSRTVTVIVKAERPNQPPSLF